MKLGELDLGRVIWVVAAPLAAVLLAGCNPPSPSREELIGMWTNESGVKLNFERDGSLEAVHLPQSALIALGSGEEVVGRGRWRLKVPPGTREFGMFWWEVELDFPAQPGFSGGLESSVMFSSDGTPHILEFWSYGEPTESDIVLTKK